MAAVELCGISKHYPSTIALKDINLRIDPGTVHAFIGENGAGKSTCLGIISGRVVPTAGQAKIFGAEAAVGRPRDLRRAGVAAIYQELTIAPNLTPSQNVFLGAFPSRRGMLDSATMRRRYEELAQQLGVVTQSEMPAKVLSVADQQILEILRALASDARILLFDEPTASLGRSEREALLRLIESLKAEGRTIVFVSHNLDEVMQVSDRISVFRDGDLVADLDASTATKHQLVSHMLAEGRTAELLEQPMEGSSDLSGAGAGEEILRVENLQLPGLLAPMSFNVREGEILGIGGLVGSGRTEMLRCLAGLEVTSQGEMWVKGQQVNWPHTVRNAQRLGIVLVPEDRKTTGVIPLLSSAENIGLGTLAKRCGSWITTPKRVRAAAADVAPRYGIAMDRLDDPAGTLSGGNQQKLLLSRAGSRQPTLLLADEPTRGIDVGAKAEIMDTLRDLASGGRAVIVVSSELEEVVAMSDRVLVLRDGHLVAELDGATETISVDKILAAAFGLMDSESEVPV